MRGTENDKEPAILPDSYDSFLRDYLYNTRWQAFLAVLAILTITAPFEFWLWTKFHNFPIGLLLAERMVLVSALSLLLYQRIKSYPSKVPQLTYIWCNFALIALFVGGAGASVDQAIGQPFYAAAGIAIVAACSHYPMNLRTALCFSGSIAVLFFSSYTIAALFWPGPGFYVALLVCMSGPIIATYGSLRLSQAFRRSFEANLALRSSGQRMEASKELMAVTLERLAEAVISIDASGRVVRYNLAAAALLKRREVDALGFKIEDVLPLRTAAGDEMEIDFLEMGPLGEPQSEFESRLVVDGELGPLVRVLGSPILSPENQKLGAVFVIQDMTTSTHLDDERLRNSKLESLGVLAGGIAHDFNNILTAIQGNMTLAQMDMEDGCDPKDSFEDALFGVQRARDLASQLLTFAKGGAPICKTVELSEIVRRSVDFVLAGSKCRAQFKGDEQLQVFVDPSQIGQVVENLTVNSLEAMPDGGTFKVGFSIVECGEKYHPDLDEHTYARVSFRDQGPGIPRELLGQIFDPYFTTKDSGSGLGLATSFSVCRRHGGTLLVSNPPGGGALFDLFLPLSTTRRF